MQSLASQTVQKFKKSSLKVSCPIPVFEVSPGKCGLLIPEFSDVYTEGKKHPQNRIAAHRRAKRLLIPPSPNTAD